MKAGGFQGGDQVCVKGGGSLVPLAIIPAQVMREWESSAGFIKTPGVGCSVGRLALHVWEVLHTERVIGGG